MTQMNRARETPSETTVVPPKSRWVRLLEVLGDPWGYVLVLPAVLLYATFQIWPIIRGLLMAFSPYSWVVPETKGLLTFNGLDNYRTLLYNQEWRHSMWVSMKLTAGAYPLNFVVSMFTAVMISKLQNPRWSGFMRIVTYLPVVLPISSSMLLWRNIYSPQYGYINHFLRTVLGWKNPPLWLDNYKWALFSTIPPIVWKDFGNNTLLFLIGMYSINRELYEAAEIDGASEWQQFWKVTLPLLKPIIVLVLVLSAGLLSATTEIMVLFSGGVIGTIAFDTAGGPFGAAMTAGLFSWVTAFIRPDMRMGLAASASLILGLIHIALSALVFRTVRVERF